MAFVICAALTVAGLVAAWGRWRRKSPRAGVRMLAWAVLPMAFYLTGLADLIERIGSAFVKFGAAFVFSPKTWAGVVLAAIAVLLLVVSGGLPAVSRKSRAAKKDRAGKDGAPSQEPGPQALAVGNGKTRKRAAQDDDGIGDVEEILRRRGIS